MGTVSAFSGETETRSSASSENDSATDGVGIERRDPLTVTNI